jgi:hypothetical protein
VVIEVLNSGGSVVETVDTFTSSYTDGQYRYQLGNYSGQTITIRFRMMVMPDPGDTGLPAR